MQGLRNVSKLAWTMAALALLASACSDSDGSADTTLPPTSTTVVATTVPPPTTTQPPATTTTQPPATTTSTASTTTTTDPFAAARTTLAEVLDFCNTYSAGVNGFEPFDGSDTDPSVGGEFTGEVTRGVFAYVDGTGLDLLVDVDGGIVTGPDGPDGIAPRPYSFWCPPEVFPGTLDEGDPDATAVVLEAGGLGAVAFGAEAEATIADLTALLGEPDADSGWIDSFSGFGTCPGSQVRVVAWDELQVYLTDAPVAFGDYPDPGGPHFFSWLAADFVDAAPPAYGFETALGVGVGSPLGFVEEAYGDVGVAYDDDFEFWYFEIEGGGILGTLEGDTANSLVTSLQGGQGCGE